MKILAVRGRNLASLGGDFAVELDQEPLSAAGLFAITGATGSGKSTILDALCLALYDRVPRLADSSRAVEVGRSGDPPGQRIKSTDVRSLLRIGSGEGFAEVDFNGVDGRLYRARWSVHRARNRADGRLQPQEMQLNDLGSGQGIGATRTEVLDAIAERLGLSFEQFRRSALLAQGDFAAFLRAGPKERSELLERITGTEIYTRLSKGAHRREAEESAELRILEGRLEGCPVLDDDARRELEEDRDGNHRALAEAEAAVKAARRDLDWQMRLERLHQAEAEAAEASSAAERAWTEAEGRRQALEAATAVRPIRPLLEAYDRGHGMLDAATRERRRVSAELESANAATGALQSRLEAAEQAQRDAALRLEERRPQLLEARKIEARLAHLDKDIDHLHGDLKRSTARAGSAQRELTDRQKALKGLEHEHKAATSWLAENRRFEMLGRRWDRWQTMLERLTGAHRDRSAGDEKRERLAHEVEATAGRLAAARRAEERALAARKEEVESLRAMLSKGEPCPVCGSTEHPWSSRLPLEDHEGGTGRPSFAASGLEDGATSEEHDDTAEIQRRHLDKVAELQATDETARRARSEWEESLESLAEALAEVPDWRARAESDPLAFSESCAEWATAWRDQRDTVAGLEAERNNQGPGLAAAETAHRHAAAEAERLAERARASRHDRDAQRLELDELTSGMSADEAAAELENRLAVARDSASASREAFADSKQKLAAARQSLEGTEQLLSARQEDLTRAREALDQALERCAVEEDEARRLLGRDDAWQEKERQQLETLRQRRDEAQIRLAERRTTLAEHHAEDPPQGSADEIREALEGAEARRRAANDALNESQFRLRQDDEARARREKLGGDLREQNERWQVWASLKELIGSADGSKFRTFAQSLTLDALLAHANQHLKDLARRYHLERVPGSDLELQVVDRDMADEVRSVVSLSGGESFLVSLALALGLASLSSERTQVESLFIDEGFGSLDSDSLETALASLDSLQSLGRQVGVISHISTLVERIGFQIRVEARGGGKSVVSVLGCG